MNCSTFKKQLEESIENRLVNTSPEFEKHINVCATCAELAKSSYTLDRVIERWKNEKFDIDLVDRVLANVDTFEQESSTEKVTVSNNQKFEKLEFIKPARKNQSRFATLSAALLVMLTSVLLIQSNRDETSTGSFATRNGSYSTNSTEKNMELDEIIFDVGSAYLALANNTADSVSGAVNIVSSREKNENEVNQSKGRFQYQWIKSLGNDLKPIQKDLGEAMDFLYESLPEDSPSTI